ncbi:SLAIN motif-containing protein-like isoform X2 [Echeneis naucrates]|uniref:SLAIN motif-containing protein-like isoform X2 n=1 Tax=Echeneis naucrates TaxID=173247 RepID=UPI001113E035|nr:SLAIN motif-containing protein-like isoform X2 [Echeneis naucrates]
MTIRKRLYESPRKLETVEKTQSALRWCRHVLDNPSPEMEAACRLLIHRLDERSSSNFYKRPVCPLTGNDAICSPVDRSSFNSAQTTSGGLDNSDLSVSHDSINTNYRLEDITDVHIMARIQEASLRQDCVSSSAVASPRRCPESAVKLLSYFNSTEENVDDFTPRNAAECSSSSYWQPALLSPRSSSSLLSPAAKQSSQSPKLATLHQQVTQFKLFKLTQNQGWTKSPARTSLRSLQAVRNSRSVETDGCNLTDHIIQPPSGSSSISRCSQSPSAARMNSNVSLPSSRDSSIRVTSMKKLQRSQSLSPCRIPHPAKGCLSFNGRVFASPETLSTVAWTRNGPSARQ